MWALQPCIVVLWYCLVFSISVSIISVSFSLSFLVLHRDIPLWRSGGIWLIFLVRDLMPGRSLEPALLYRLSNLAWPEITWPILSDDVRTALAKHCTLLVRCTLLVSDVGWCFIHSFILPPPPRSGMMDNSEAVQLVCIVGAPRHSIEAPHQQQEPMRRVRCVALAWPLV